MQSGISADLKTKLENSIAPKMNNSIKVNSTMLPLDFPAPEVTASLAFKQVANSEYSLPVSNQTLIHQPQHVHFDGVATTITHDQGVNLLASKNVKANNSLSAVVGQKVRSESIYGVDISKFNYTDAANGNVSFSATSRGVIPTQPVAPGNSKISSSVEHCNIQDVVAQDHLTAGNYNGQLQIESSTAYSGKEEFMSYTTSSNLSLANNSTPSVVSHEVFSFPLSKLKRSRAINTSMVSKEAVLTSDFDTVMHDVPAISNNPIRRFQFSSRQPQLKPLDRVPVEQGNSLDASLLQTTNGGVYLSTNSPLTAVSRADIRDFPVVGQLRVIHKDSSPATYSMVAPLCYSTSEALYSSVISTIMDPDISVEESARCISEGISKKRRLIVQDESGPSSQLHSKQVVTGVTQLPLDK